MEQRKSKGYLSRLLIGALIVIVGWTLWQGKGAVASSGVGLPGAPDGQVARPYPLFSIAGDSQGEFKRPLAVIEGPDNAIYVADSGQGSIRVFDVTGMPLRSFGADPDDQGRVSYPLGLAFDDQGALYVADSTQEVVRKYNQQGEYLGTFGQGIKRPGGVFFRDGRFFINDLDLHQVLALNRAGQVDRVIGEGRGTKPGQLSYPNATWADAEGNVYVSDSNNNRVQVFASDGALQQVIRESSLGIPVELPRGLAMDSLGRLHVVSAFGHRVEVYDSAGKPLFAYGGNGELEGQLGLPNGIFISKNRIYIAETGNRRVQVWGY